jgi:hypothetical protein
LNDDDRTRSRAGWSIETQSAMKRPRPARSVELPGQRRSASAAGAVAQNQYFFDLELGDREFERGRDAVIARRRLDRAGSRLATLRTTKISPGLVSKIWAGSTRLSEQAITITGGSGPCQLAPALPFLRPAGFDGSAIALDQID